MGDDSNKSDEELERLYYEGNTRASRDAENKLYDRGYTLDSDSDTWDLASNQNDAHSVGIPIPTGQGTFLLFLVILIAGLIAFFIGGFLVIAYAVEYATYIYQFSQEDSFLKEREGRSPASRWEMNWLRTRDRRRSS
nr:hypothetical protein [Bacillus cereus]